MVLAHPATPAAAADYVEEWFRFPNVIPLNPGRDHLALFRRCLAAAGVGANLVTDAHLAALAMEYQAEAALHRHGLRALSGPPLAQPALSAGAVDSSVDKRGFVIHAIPAEAGIQACTGNLNDDRWVEESPRDTSARLAFGCIVGVCHASMSTSTIAPAPR